MALNKDVESGTKLYKQGKTRFTGKFLRKNGLKYNTQNGEKIDPKGSYVRNSSDVMNTIKNNHPTKINFRGSELKKNGINYNPYSNHLEKIDPNKTYSMNRDAIQDQMNLNRQPTKINYRGKFLKANGVNYNPYSRTREAIDPNKTYRMNRNDMDQQIKDNNTPTKINYRGDFLKANGINYNPYSKTREAIDPHKTYAMNRDTMDQQIKDNMTPTKINYRGNFLKKHGINYDVDNGKKIQPNHNYKMTRNVTDSAIRNHDYVKDHPYSSAHPNIGWKGDLKRKAHQLGAKLNKGVKYQPHKKYSGSYLIKNGINFNPYKKLTMKSKPLDPNKVYSFPGKDMDGYIKVSQDRMHQKQFKKDHPYSSAHPNRGFVGDMLHKGSLDAHGVKNALHSKLQHAFSGGVSHSVSAKRPTTVRGFSKGKTRALIGRDASARHGIIAGMHKGGLHKSPKKTIARKARANKQGFHL